MYDYKGKFSMNSAATQKKKEAFVQKLRTNLGVTTLAKEFVNDSKAYFNVFESV